MWIREIYIDGFGIYSKTDIPHLPGGLVLFYGLNESGKTTLMEFIRTALFGFPSRQWKHHYPPLRGGSHGGRIVIEMNHHPPFISELKNGRVQLVTIDGQPLQTSLTDLLQGVDRATYGRIFAIGLDELQGLDFFHEPDFAGRILAASAGLRAGRLTDALKNLQAEMDQYHRPRARKALLNNLLNELKMVQQEIKRRQKELKEYRGLTEESEKLADQLEKLRTEKHELERRRVHLELLHKARRPWVDWSRAREQCQALVHVAGFPPNGAQQMKTLQEKKISFQADLEKEKQNLEMIQKKRASLSIQESILAAANEIRTLASERQKFQSALDDILEIRLKSEKAREKFQKALKELGPGWDEKRLLSVNASLPVRQKVRDFETALREKQQVLERLKQEREALSRQLQQQKKVITELKEREKALPSIESTISELTEKQHQLERLSDLLVQQSHLAEKIEHAKSTLQNLSLLKTTVRPVTDLHSPWMIILLPIMLGGGAVGLFLLTRARLLSPIGFLAATLLTFSVFSLRWAIKHGHRIRQQQAQFQNHQQQLQKQLDEINDDLNRLQQEQAERQQKITTIAESLGLSSPHRESIRLMQQKIAEDLDVLHHRESLRTEIQQQLKRYHDLETKLQNLDQKRDEAKQSLDAAENEWQTWITERGFDAGLRPTSFETLLEHLEKTLTYRENFVESEERLSIMEQYLHEIKERIQKIFKMCDLEVPQNPSPSDIDRLVHCLNEQEKVREALNQLDIDASRIRKNIKRLTKQLNDIESSINELLDRTGCRDIDEFFQKAELFSQYQQYLEEMNKYEAALLALTGNKKSLKRVIEELEDKDEETVAAEVNEIHQRLQEIETREREKAEIYGRLKEKIAQMETEERLSTLLFERVRIQNAIKQAVKAWGTRVLTLYFLNRAREIYEHLRQPEVIRHADAFLRSMTGDRYCLILTSDDHSVLLEDRERHRKTEVQWSHGLADQVYLAVRLGLARSFSKEREPIPLILDDILVRFDEFRQQKAIECLLEVARHQQIFLFTCRPEVVESIRAVVHNQKQTPPLEYYQLDNGQIHSSKL